MHENQDLSKPFIAIVVQDRGHVSIARLKLHDKLEFHWHFLTERTIRKWGTARGLNQLAEQGPTKDTILDDPAEVIVPFRWIGKIILVNEAKWEDSL